MSKFKSGVLVGVLGTLATIATAALAYHQTCIKPEIQAEEDYENASQRSTRKAISSHQARF